MPNRQLRFQTSLMFFMYFMMNDLQEISGKVVESSGNGLGVLFFHAATTCMLDMVGVFFQLYCIITCCRKQANCHFSE